MTGAEIQSTTSVNLNQGLWEVSGLVVLLEADERGLERAA